jgi:hypothetical protein
MLSNRPILDVLESVMLLCLSIYTFVSLIKLKPNALFLGKLFSGIVLFRGILPVIASSLISWTYVLISIVALIYLFFSKQTQNLFPKAQRTVYKIDIVIVIVAVLLVILCTLFATTTWINIFGGFMWI